MHFKLDLDIDCNGIKSDVCAEIIYNALKEIGNPVVDVPNDKMFGHVSIYHQKNAHIIWVFYYDNDGMTESVSYDWEPKKAHKTYDMLREMPTMITGTDKDGNQIPKTQMMGGTERIILQPHDRTFSAATKPSKTKVINAIQKTITTKKTPLVSKITEANESIESRALLPGIIDAL